MNTGIRFTSTRIAVRRRLKALAQGGSSNDRQAFIDWINARYARRSSLARELVSAFGEQPTLSKFRFAERLLPQVKRKRTLSGLEKRLRASQPDLLFFALRDLKALPRPESKVALSTMLDDDALLDGVDVTEIEELVETALQFANKRMFDRVLTLIGAQRSPSEASHEALFGLVELRASEDGASPVVPASLDAWTRSPEDLTLVFRVALAMGRADVVATLAPRVRPDDLKEQVRGRAAEKLWRHGDVEESLRFARAVGDQVDSAARRAKGIIGEWESLEMMYSGWKPDPRSPQTAYDVDTRSILHVLENSLPYRRTGSCNRSQGLLAGLARAGYRATALTRPGFPAEDVAPGTKVLTSHEIDGVSYHHILNGGVVLDRFPIRTFLDAYSGAITAQARIESAGLIHAASNAHNALAAIVSARALGVPSVYEVRGLNEEQRRSFDPTYADSKSYELGRYLETLAAHEADRVIAITEGLKATLVERGVDPTKITVVPNGVDNTRFTPSARDEALAKHYGLEGMLVIGYLGSLNWYEGHELLFEAMSVLRHRHPHVRLLIVGEGVNLENLLRLRSDLGLEDIVLMPGSVPPEQVQAHYSLVDIAPIARTSSPVTETVSPLKPFEAMAMAKTVVSSDVAVMTEIIEDGMNGKLFTKGDVASLIEVLDELISDDELRTRLGRQAREWVVAERDWDRLAERVTGIYAELGVS